MFRLCWAALNCLWQFLCAIARLPRQAAVALDAPSADHPARPQRLLLALLASLPPCFATAIVLPQMMLVMSPSIDAWIVRPVPGEIVRGDLVQFELSHPAIGPRPVSATKYVLCMPGDRLDIVERPSRVTGMSEGHYYCNGALLGISLARGPDGQRLLHVTGSGIIRKGFAYVGSSHARGFDSRYIGLVPIARLRRMEKLI